ncbi:putative zinc-binding alcohol dehydrogenase domain-containing protein cipB [Amylocarpus encephaloides]|uniref:Zinc-binding alcohol dehydrogenase domain-containing protein cipB n=1 Tax=Amylocarpus encephaloides TaxID=45428 RepID=A0A9P7YIC8_9HELO|nr:putative zinc-binding alcohol dehydrogenase domain-containing protein cipB [Amylocarpus encephaloides]
MSATKKINNNAAWLPEPKSKNLALSSASYTKPEDNQIVIKNAAVAINPVDWMMETEAGPMVYPHLKYPFVIGSDVAGTVVEVGSLVGRFKVGDRVVGFALGTAPGLDSSTAEGAFQLYTVLRAHMASHIPDNLSFESAAVIPLGLSTAACGLFQKDMLALRHPTVPPAARTGEILLIWGGSTSVGCNAIQLAVAAGYEVITTSSPKNFELCKKLGASQVFDYNSQTVVQDITEVFRGKTCAGAYSIGAGAAEACLEILSKSKGSKFIAMATYPMAQKPLESFVLIRMMFGYVSWNIAHWIKSKMKGVHSSFIFATTLANNGVGNFIYENFLSQALAAGSFVASPEPLVVGKGLESIQGAMEVQRKGVSARKVVVTL